MIKYMKYYHIFFFILKFIILLLISLISLKIIPIKTKIYIIIDFIFKISFSIFIIVFFTMNKYDNLKNDDRILIILSGFILLLLIDYIRVINVLFNIHIEDYS
jgi:hypothetical protein